MPMCRAISIFLMLLIIPTSAFAKTPEKHRHKSSDAAADTDEGAVDPNWRPRRTTGRSEYGKAAWYGLVGSYTSSGEILDIVTPTAAHRTLPLHSYAKVTNLDTGRSLIVKINDRGPYTQGRIIDLSPRAAEQLNMKRAGVVPVTVEPVVNELGLQRPAPDDRAAVTSAAVAESREARAEVAASSAAPAPAWVDPRLEQPASDNQAAGGLASTPEARQARAEAGATKASPAPAWIDPRLEQPTPNNRDAATPSAAAPEVREAPAEAGLRKTSSAPAWIDPRLEGQ